MAHKKSYVVLLVAALAQGCGYDCEVVSANEDSPQLATAAEVIDYCQSNTSADIICLVEFENKGSYSCTTHPFGCNEPELEQEMKDWFNLGGIYCVEAPAKLVANF